MELLKSVSFLFVLFTCDIATSTSMHDHPNEIIPNNKLRVCYYASDSNLTPDKLDPHICTHILFAFATLNNNSLAAKFDRDPELYKQLVKLKDKNPSLNVMLSVAGGPWNGFPAMASTVESRSQFIQSVLETLVKYGFDGLDIDWEFPVFDSTPADKQNFATLLNELHMAFAPTSTNQVDKFLLSAALASVEVIVSKSYDIYAVKTFLDFLNIMCYDYHYYQLVSPITGINSPLYHRPIEKGYLAEFNINWTVNYWLGFGVEKSKLIIGLPTYAHTFQLKNPKYHDIACLAVGPGLGNGSLTYEQVCDLLKANFTKVFDYYTQSPYLYNNTDWVSYDDEQSLASKVQYVKQMNLGGVMTWNLNSDDWEAKCDGKTQFPLHKVISNLL